MLLKQYLNFKYNLSSNFIIYGRVKIYFVKRYNTILVSLIQLSTKQMV